MKVPFYDIKAQYDELQQPIDAAVHEVISSGTYTISGGKHCLQLEEAVAKFHQTKHAISLNSGTDALRILMDSAGIGPGDEVITTAFTFVASVETIMQTGAAPVFADIELDTLQIDPRSIEAAITPRTKAIMPVHLFGQMADVDAISAIAKRHNLIVIEDTAQAIGSRHNGVPAGNFGIGAGLSFYVTKNLGAAGDAGMILTNDDAIAESCRSIRVHGMGRERYYYDHLGYTSRMDEVQAAFLHVKLSALEKWNNRRAQLAAIYEEVLADSNLKLLKTLPGNNHTYHQYAVLCERRDELQAELRKAEVDSMIYYPVPIHKHLPYKGCKIGPTGLARSEEAANTVLCLPVHPHLQEDQVQFAAEQAKNFSLNLVAR